MIGPAARQPPPPPVQLNTFTVRLTTFAGHLNTMHILSPVCGLLAHVFAMYVAACNNGTNAELLECLTHWQSMASGNRGNSAGNTGRRVHILRCSIEHSRQTRQGDWAGNRQAGNRESCPRVLREFLRRVNGYLLLSICPALFTHPLHIHGLSI